MSITPITLGYKDRLYRVSLDEMVDILKVDRYNISAKKI